jgi:peroxiredoxin
LAELRELLRPSDDAVLVAIGVDPVEKNKDLAERIAKDNKGTVAFRILSDPGHKTIDAYGVFDPAYLGDENEGIPHPAVFVIDRGRKIVWSKVESDYRKRPTVAQIRAELKKLNKP